MMRRGLGRLCGIALAAMLPLSAARGDDQPPDQVGRSTIVVNDVDGQTGEAPPRRLAVDDDIYFAEDITTGADAKTIIEFRDGSTFEIGPDAVIRIDSFVFNPEESTSHKALQVTRGVFRYVSGYTAGDQDTKIALPTGALAIRGSVAEGIVDPEVPAFVYLGDGAASFANNAGATDLRAGDAIAVPSPTTAPLPPAAMPAAVAAQALQAIERRLPPRAVRRRPADDEAWLRRAGAANLVPVAAQAQRETATSGSRPLPTPAAHGSIAGEVGLLVEGNRLNLFATGPGARTAEQSAFVAQAARTNPNAGGFMTRARAQAGALHAATNAGATASVIHGVARAGSAETLQRVVAAGARANPTAAAQIRRHANEAAHAGERHEHADRHEQGRHERSNRHEQNRHAGRGGEPRHPPNAHHERPSHEKSPQQRGQEHRQRGDQRQ